MALLLFLTLYLSMLLLPGWCLTRLLNIRRWTFLLSFSLSFALAILAVAILTALKAPTTWAWLIWPGLPAALLLLTALQAAIRRLRRKEPHCLNRHPARSPTIAWLMPIGLLLITTGYLFYARPYTEIPADVFNHLDRIHQAVSVLAGDTFLWRYTGWKLWLNQGHFWYLLPAWMGQQSQVSDTTLLWGLTLTNVSIFLLSSYYFALFALRAWRVPRATKYYTAALASLFTGLTLGFNVFSYIRYYALAPAIVNHVLFLAALAIFWDYLWRRQWFTRELLLLPLLAIAMQLTHSQELLFFLLMALGILLVEAGRQWLAHQKTCQWRDTKTIKIFLLSGLAVTGCAVLFVVLHTRPLVLKVALEPYLVPVQTVIPFLKDMLIAPWNGRFYEVIGIWGIFVYLLFLIKIKHFKNNAYLLAGMFLPFFTMFNPVMVDLLLRLGVNPVLFYRLAYTLPLPLVAAMLFVSAGCRLTTGVVLPKKTPLWHGRWLMPLLVLIGILLLHLPISGRWVDAPCSRMHTLRRLPPQNDWRLWSDLIEFMNQLDEPRHIVTDRITGFVINATSEHKTYTTWFHRSWYAFWLESQDAKKLAALRLNKRFQWLLVINERDGGFNVNGALSTHWPGDVLKMSQYYSEECKQYVVEHPDKFKLIWERDGIRVFEIVDGK